MAAKRFSDESDDQNPDQPNEKRRRNIPSFASVIGEAVMVNSLKKIFMSLEPMLRKVVSEEVEGTLQRCSSSFTRSPSLRIQELEQSSLQLVFSKKLSLPIFTGSKIVDAETNASLQVILVQTGGDHMVLTSLPHPIKLEIVVLDGDFPSNDRYIWTSEEFENKIVKERTGKRPLLAGDCLTLTLKDGVAPIGDIEFTDNSSWIRSRKFRIGAKVAPGSYPGLRIREAMTEAFVVKDHRGELYKKHHPPSLEDEVWRLEKIAKDGAFHKKLAAEGINTVQDFLKLSTVHPQKLRTILGVGMSEKMWEVSVKHARKCLLGNKRYVLRGPTYTITLNPVCQVVNAIIDGQTFTLGDLSSIDRTYIKDLIMKAYHEWHSLEEVVAISNETPLLTQGEPVNPYPNHQQTMVKPPHQGGSTGDRYMIQDGILPSINAETGFNNWQFMASPYLGMPAEPGRGYSLSESTSDSELTPSGSYRNTN